MAQRYIEDLVSVVIPTYNSARFLPQAIESVLSQTYPRYELIVVDDGSTDDTESIVKRYADNLLYLHKPNGGPASARNVGIEAAQGEYVAFLDADDYWLPEKLAAQIAFFKIHSHYGMTHTNAWVVETGHGPLPAHINPPLSGNIFPSLFMGNCVYNLTVMAKHAILDLVGRFDESRELIGLEDYDLWIRMAMHYEVGFIDKILGVYRIHDSNISNEGKAIASLRFLLEKFRHPTHRVEEDFPGLLLKKKRYLHFRSGCHLVQDGHYKEAREQFSQARKQEGLRVPSLVGLMSCLLGTNVLLRSWILSIKYKKHGDYRWDIGDYAAAEHYYLRSIQSSVLQWTAMRRLLLVELRRLQPFLLRRKGVHQESPEEVKDMTPKVFRSDGDAT